MADASTVAMSQDGRRRVRRSARRFPFIGTGVPTALAVGAIAFVVAWSRLSPTTRRTLWAEDGEFFLHDAAMAHGFATTWLRPYDGYLHLVPRIASQLLVAAVPPRGYAVVDTAISCLVAAGVAALVAHLTATLTGSRTLRLTFAGITVLAPFLPVEVLGNLANLHWFFLWLTPWLLLGRARTRRGALLLGVVGFVTAATEVQAVYFLPVIAWQWRDRRRWPVRTGVLLGMACQAVAVMTSHRAPKTGIEPAVATIAKGYLSNVVMPLWHGTGAGVSSTLATFGWGAAIVSFLPSVAAVAVVLWRGTPAQRVAAVILPVVSGVAWVTALVVNRPNYTWVRPRGEDHVALLRYGIVPSMLLLAGLVLALATLRLRHPTEAGIALALGVPAVLAVLMAFSPAGQLRDAGPVWSDQVDRRLPQCQGRAAGFVGLDIAPDRWLAVLPCSLLVGR